MEKSLRQQIQHLCGYISDRSAVLQHVNREHNLRLTLQDINDAATSRHRPRRADFSPMTPSPLIVTHKRTGYDDLALALFKYHAARTFGPDQVFWLNRLNDKRAKPATTMEI